MPFFVAVKNERESPNWRLLFRAEALAGALRAYRAVSVRAGERKVLAEWGGGGWEVVAHAAGDLPETGTDQARADRTDQTRGGDAREETP